MEFERWKWHNEPPSWNEQEGAIAVTSGRRTDFWRKTHYGFIRDNGNFYYRQVKGNFTAEVKVTGQCRALYDQAGLMVRRDETTWLKCGIEFVDGVQHVSAVVTRDYSDWSVVPLSHHPTSLWLRLKREGPAIEVQYSLDGQQYTMLRLSYLTETETLQVGLMCASPESDGFPVTFEGFKLDSHPKPSD